MATMNPMRTPYVLVVVDMLVDFFERSPALGAQRSSLARAINALVTEFRRARQPIVWVRQEFNPDLSDAFLDMRRTGTSITIAGSPGAAILPELARLAGDEVVVKKRYSAFFGTNFETVLGRLTPASIVLAGINSHACIRTTAIDAYQRDYDVVLASECIGSGDAAHHAVTMAYLDDHIARVWSNEQIARCLAAI
jgi:maleamate amidohydrolase